MNNQIELIDNYTYAKKILSGKNKTEKMLLKHIQQICEEMGYILVEIKITNKQ